MPSPSVTYTFANSTTADATQVNQNFSDIINGLTDGTKDLSINALTCAGSATLNGNVTLGNASSDDLTVTASLASHLAIKTTATYNFGSATLGLLSMYLGNSTFTTRLLSAATSSYTWTFPVTGGTSRYQLETDGSGGTSWQPTRRSSDDAHNVGIACAVAANALTITLKGADGNDPSATNPVDIVFRNATSATGTPVTRTVTSAITTTISSGSTGGHIDAKIGFLYVYAIDNAGTVELAWSSKYFDEGSVVTTTAEGGAGAADDGATIYSTTARTGVAVRLLARMKSTQTTAGTWAAVPTEISLIPNKNSIYAYYSTNAGQALGNGTSDIINFEDKTTDTYDSVTTGASWKFHAPEAGDYFVGATIQLASASYTLAKRLTLDLYKNNGQVITLDRNDISVTGTQQPHAAGAHIITLAAGDYIDVRANYNEASKSLNATGAVNAISIRKVG